MPSRVMVRSLSMPPRELSSWVYVIVPTPRSTSLAARRPSRSSAPGPTTSNLAKDDSSNSPAVRAGRQVLGDDGRRPVLAGPAARPQRLVGGVLVAAVPVHPLPARLLAEDGAEPLVTGVGRWEPQRPTGGALVVGVGDVVVRRVHLVGAGQAVAAGAVVRPEATDVHPPEVTGRFAADDPLGDHLPVAAGSGDAVGAEAGRHEEPGHVALAEDELAVGRERLRAVDELVHVGVDQRGHERLCSLGQREEAIPVGGEELVVERGGDLARDAPRRRIALVAAHDHPADLLAEVDEAIGVAHRRQARRHRHPGAGDGVLVGHRHDRHVHAGESTDLVGEHASGVDDDLALDSGGAGGGGDVDVGDAAAVGPLAHGGDADAGDPRAGRDLDAGGAGPGGQGHRQVAGVEPAVGGQPHGAEDTGRIEPALEQRRGLRGGDELERKAERLGPSGLTAQLLEPFGCRGETQRPHLVPAGVVSGLGVQAAVQLGPVHHHRREGDRPAELADEPGGVERRAARELVPLDQQDVGPTELGEVVGDGCAADPAADDHHTGPVADRRDTTQRRRATSRRRGRRPTGSRW